MAFAAREDGLDHGDIGRLAQLRTEGLHSGHMARDLQLCLQPNMLEGSLTRMSLMTKIGAQERQVMYSAILPHILFAQLWERDPKVFFRFFAGEDEVNLQNW